MTLTHIVVFIGISLLIRFIGHKPVANWLILVVSLLAVYWLQPVSAIRSLEYWLPSLLVAVCILIWLLITPTEKVEQKENIISAAIAAGIMVLISLLRYIAPGLLTGIINPPAVMMVLVILAIITVMGWVFWKTNGLPRFSRLIGAIAVIMLIGIFLVLKYEPFRESASVLFRKWNDQTISLANAREIAWVGYSYFAFRLIHVLREWQQGRVFNADLRMFLIYVLFFPSFTAGPIERLDRFERNFSKREDNDLGEDLLTSGTRITRGLLYKFIIADSLALVAFDADSIQAVNSSFWMLIIIYCYALRLYFDFSGYTDLAIGIAMLMGIRIPENFDHPYRSTNLTLFWNRWHITLTQWFRTYYFNPVTRFLRTRKLQISPSVIIVFTQISTMILIGLWHGLSINFVMWGLWNGIGLFIQNRWSDWRKTRDAGSEKSIIIQYLGKAFSILLTFNYIALGWVWFALPDMQDSILVFSKLLGGM